MAAAGEIQNYEEVDLFTVPHNRMKKILERVSRRVKHTDFSNSISFRSLLSELLTTFTELKTHEEIENKYIMKILKRRLHGQALKKLLIHLHAHSHISDILNQVKKAEREFIEGLSTDMKTQGLKLNEVVQEFFDEYLPHMIEEEQVLQPLLMEFLPTDELKHIKEIVLRLHQLKDLEEKRQAVEKFQTHFQELHIKNKGEEEQLSSIDILPPELLSMILSYLNPKDLCRCAQVKRSWDQVVFSGELWHSLHPSLWASGDWRFGNSLTSDDCNCDCLPNYDLVTYKDYTDIMSDRSETEDNTSSSSDSDESLDKHVRREARILNGLSRYVLPRVGSSVKTLVLECSKAITNGLLFRILSKCCNLEYLDVSQTIISDIGLLGLFKVECHRLLHLDISGCKEITDKTLIKLSTALGKPKCCCKGNNVSNSSIRQLNTLRLSGCYKITDAGLRALCKYGGLPRLQHIDLSGCFNLTGGGIKELISSSHSLNPTELFYCDYFDEAPYAEQAGGCQNGDCLNRVCCQNLRVL